MTALTVIVGGEPTARRRPLGSMTVPTRPLMAQGLDLDVFVELDESEEWVVEDMPTAWRRPELMRVFSAGMPPVTRAILEEIARRPEGYPFDALHHILRMTRLTVAANLDAATAAARAFPSKPALVRRDYRMRTYCMPHEVAAFLAPLPHSQEDRAD